MNFSKLIIPRNCIGDDGIKILADSLTFTRHVVVLDISSNCISDTGANYLFTKLIMNESIVDLKIKSLEGLNRNRLTDKSMTSLSNLLAKPLSTLNFLDISGNSIGNMGIKHLSEGL